MLKINCRSCGADFCEPKKTKSHGFCQRGACAKEGTIWRKRNFDQMGPSKFKSKYEAEFYELNDVQTEHYSTFLNLIRRANTDSKKRKCLKCRDSFLSRGNRICSRCAIMNSYVGASAVC